MSTQTPHEIGHEAGVAAGSWVIDGNTNEATAKAILQGIEDGDPEIMDIQPAPLSGEWAGESVGELSDKFGINLHDAETADAFEAGFSEGFWHEVERTAH